MKKMFVIFMVINVMAEPIRLNAIQNVCELGNCKAVTKEGSVYFYGLHELKEQITGEMVLANIKFFGFSNIIEGVKVLNLFGLHIVYGDPKGLPLWMLFNWKKQKVTNEEDMQVAVEANNAAVNAGGGANTSQDNSIVGNGVNSVMDGNEMNHGGGNTEGTGMENGQDDKQGVPKKEKEGEKSLPGDQPKPGNQQKPVDPLAPKPGNQQEPGQVPSAPKPKPVDPSAPEPEKKQEQVDSSKPGNPSEPKPGNPSEPKPGNPSEPKPGNPSEPKPVDSSKPKPAAPQPQVQKEFRPIDLKQDSDCFERFLNTNALYCLEKRCNGDKYRLCVIPLYDKIDKITMIGYTLKLELVNPYLRDNDLIFAVKMLVYKDDSVEIEKLGQGFKTKLSNIKDLFEMTGWSFGEKKKCSINIKVSDTGICNVLRAIQAMFN